MRIAAALRISSGVKLPPQTREERATRAKVIIDTRFNSKQQVFLDFVDWQFRGTPPPQRYDECPFSDLPRAFAWAAPKAT